MDRYCGNHVLAGIVLLFASVTTHAQAPSANLDYLQTVAVPNWTATGANSANFDLFAFNPVNHVMYIADRTNHGVVAIDTHTNAVAGTFVVPGRPSTNGVVVAPDLQQLVLTDGKTSVFVYDLRVPQGMPDQYTVPGITGGTDALDYDPLNHTVYVINGSAPYFITGIDLAFKRVSSQLALPGSPELMKWNPVDGMIYQVITDSDNKNKNAGVVVYDPVANMIRATYLTPNCVPHGIDIDPVANAALLGCGTNQAQILMSLKDGSVLKSFPDVTGTDLLGYDSNNRRFYVGAGSNVSMTTSCPADTTKAVPIVGVIDAQGQGASVGHLDGVQCSGRNGHGLGVDSLQNFVYVGVRQYPADPASSTTGSVGVVVFYDPAPPAQALTTRTQTTLAALGGDNVTGTATTYLAGRNVRMDLSAQAVSGNLALVNVTTTAGNEGIPCGKTSDTAAVCHGDLIGDPMIGGTIMLSMDGIPVAKGVIAAAN